MKLSFAFLLASVFIASVNCGGDIFALCSYEGDVGRECGEGEEGIPPQTLYFFNATSFFCEPLEFKGCGGNDNRFATLDSCDYFCIMQGDARPSERGSGF